MIEAAWWYRHHMSRLLSHVKDPRWRSVAAFAPDRARTLPGEVRDHWPQGRGDLGRRMMRMLRRAGSPSLLIGSDIHGLTHVHITRAWRTLGKNDAVIGPSPDGGFWLLGLKHPRRHPVNCLDGARWSSPYALMDTVKRLGGRTALTDMLQDIDTVEDLAMTSVHRPDNSRG
ncbi:MAG: DUF2064 domain-containing protein, partial [Pseudomonadota bacterium]